MGTARFTPPPRIRLSGIWKSIPTELNSGIVGTPLNTEDWPVNFGHSETILRSPSAPAFRPLDDMRCYLANLC
jgi:hypothetical protein